mgnify:CR=1 FL=1
MTVVQTNMCFATGHMVVNLDRTNPRVESSAGLLRGEKLGIAGIGGLFRASHVVITPAGVHSLEAHVTKQLMRGATVMYA